MRNDIIICKNFMIFLILIFNRISNCSGQASNCIVKKTNTPGECRPAEKCPNVWSDMQRGINDYTKCSASRQLVVCCSLRLYEKKCHEYQQYVYTKTYTLKLGVSGLREIKVDQCGFKRVRLISGGENAEPKQFPHMAALGQKINNKLHIQCGGSLISERFILTAAHCMIKSNPDIVRLGDLNINSENDVASPVDISVRHVYIHPNYNSDNRLNDIALIKLAHDVSFDIYKRPACLPSEQNWSGVNAIITGWGSTDSYDIHGSDHLKKATIQKFTKYECQEKLNRAKNRAARIFQVSYKTQVCAGSKTDNNDTCRGDSGGPLQVFNSREYCMWNVIGVTSYGPIGCGNKGLPGIYTRVFPYIDWIENIVWNK